MPDIKTLQFSEQNDSDVFALADGHRYFLHRIAREGKAPVYALIGAEHGNTGSFTPYVTEHQMERVLQLRSAPEGAVESMPAFVSPTGFVCPGCGATVTETGVHVGPAVPRTPAVPAVPAAEVAEVKPAGSRSRFLK